MKIDIQFTSLLSNVRKMGIDSLVPFSVIFESKPLEIITDALTTSAGLEIDIDDVITDPSGVFTYEKQHIVLFIPDHSFNYDQVLLNPKEKGNKFHLTHCSTLDDMKARNRFKRYFATTNRTGTFKIFSNSGDETEVELSVCKNCLRKLNYKNYSQNTYQVFHQFNLDEFFKYYETNFYDIPDSSKASAGYSNSWEQISLDYRKSVNFCCEECGVNLIMHKALLDVHHINGVKQDNEPQNLKALCKICHSEQPMHKHYKVRLADEMTIKKLRSKM